MNGPENEGPDFFDMPDDEVMSMPPPVNAAPAADIVEVVEKVDQVVDTGVEGAQTQEEIDAQAALDQKAADDQAAADLLAAEDAAKVTLGAEDGKEVDPNAGKVPDPAVEIDPATGKPKVAAAEELGEDGKPKPKLDAEGKPVVEKTAEELAAEAKAKEAPAAAALPSTPEEKAAAYDLLMKPIKANGKDIELRSPEELVRLAQMGANYTKKMQALQPQLRLVRMLDNSKLDESALSFLIDLHQKKPDAIQKLLADSQFDPMTIDAEKAKAYVPGDHQVSDEEVRFQAVLDDIESTPTGPALIEIVAKQWDADSKQALFQDANLFHVINGQKASGVYDRITAEMERERALGNLQGVPFLRAYHDIGSRMHAAGQLAPAEAAPAEKVEEVPQKQEPVATRVATPPAKVANDAAAKAASSTKAPPAVVKDEPNYLDMSDEDFAKGMNGRV